MPDPIALAARLAYRLEQLAAIREVAARLMGRDQKGRDFFARGLPAANAVQTDTLEDLQLAYLRILSRNWKPHA